jgi:hypothetical protein
MWGVAPSPVGARTLTKTGDPVLKKPSVALKKAGPLSASKLKLYKVPQRIAFAFGFWAKVSVFQVADWPLSGKVQGALL